MVYFDSSPLGQAVGILGVDVQLVDVGFGSSPLTFVGVGIPNVVCAWAFCTSVP